MNGLMQKTEKIFEEKSKLECKKDHTPMFYTLC